jgi:hypothetical protein
MTTTPAQSWLDQAAETVTFTVYRRKCGFHILIAQRPDTVRDALVPVIVWKACIPIGELPPNPSHRDVLVFTAHAIANPGLIDWPKCDRL